MQITPMYSGHTGFGGAGMDLIARTAEQVKQVAQFRTTVRDFAAPRMTQSSTIDAPTILERGGLIDMTA
jgi:hypothetical protein